MFLSRYVCSDPDGNIHYNIHHTAHGLSLTKGNYIGIDILYLKYNSNKKINNLKYREEKNITEAGCHRNGLIALSRRPGDPRECNYENNT